MAKRLFDPNYNDIEFEVCPLCNKDIVAGRWHKCNNNLHGTEYVNKHIGVRLLWTRDNGWRSYTEGGGDVIEDLTFADVFNWVNQDRRFELVED